MSKLPGNEGGIYYPTNTAPPTSPPYVNAEYQTGSPGHPQPPPSMGYPQPPPSMGHPLPPPPYSPNYPTVHTSAASPGFQVPAPSVTYVTMPTPINYMGGLGPESNGMVCPHCQATIKTKVKKHPSNMAYLSGCVIALFGCILGCCLIPCCMDSCKTSEHTCPNCGRTLGRYSKYF